MSASLAIGCENSTRGAPARRKRSAWARLVYWPEHSSTRSTRSACQSMASGVGLRSTFTQSPLMCRQSPSTFTSPGKRPWVESKRVRYSTLAWSARSFSATISKPSCSGRSCSARRTQRYDTAIAIERDAKRRGGHRQGELRQGASERRQLCGGWARLGTVRDPRGAACAAATARALALKRFMRHLAGATAFRCARLARIHRPPGAPDAPLRRQPQHALPPPRLPRTLRRRRGGRLRGRGVPVPLCLSCGTN